MKLPMASGGGTAPLSNSHDTREEIERRIREALSPTHLEVRDDSAAHAGHAGAIAGGGHFHIRCVSDRFEDVMLIQQHRMIHEAVGYPMDGRIHALEIKTIPLSRWQG